MLNTKNGEPRVNGRVVKTIGKPYIKKPLVSINAIDYRLLPDTPDRWIWSGNPKPKEQARIYVNVTMDCFHYGHVNFLRQCKEQCGVKFPNQVPYLIVGLCTDEDCTKFKRMPLFNWEERAAMVKACRYVDEVLKIGYVTSMELVNEMGVDIIITGSDYNRSMIGHDFPGSEHLHEYVRYTEGISTTNIIARVKARLAEDEARMLTKTVGEAGLKRMAGLTISCDNEMLS